MYFLIKNKWLLITHILIFGVIGALVSLVVFSDRYDYQESYTLSEPLDGISDEEVLILLEESMSPRVSLPETSLSYSPLGYQLEISVENGSPEQIAGIKEQLNQILTYFEISFAEEEDPYFKSTDQYPARVAIIGIFLVLGILSGILHSSIKRQVSSDKDIERYLKEKPLGYFSRDSMKTVKNHQVGIDRLDDHTLNALYGPAENLMKQARKNDIQSILVSSPNDDHGILTAAVHLSYLISQHNRKTLLINLNTSRPDQLYTYFSLDGSGMLNDVLINSHYLSRAIDNRVDDNLAIMDIDPVEQEAFLSWMEDYQFRDRMDPLLDYYDYVFIIGDVADSYRNDEVICSLVDGAVTISEDSTSNYKTLKKHLRKLGVFNVYSFGIIRNSK